MLILVKFILIYSSIDQIDLYSSIANNIDEVKFSFVKYYDLHVINLELRGLMLSSPFEFTINKRYF